MMKLLVGMFVAGVLSACAPPLANTITGANGRPIQRSDLEAIIDDDDLSDDQKRTALMDLGLTDTDLIDLLIREL